MEMLFTRNVSGHPSKAFRGEISVGIILGTGREARETGTRELVLWRNISQR